MSFDTIIFDVDGVLIDTTLSFNRAAIEAARVYTGSDRFTQTEFMMLKKIRGFNDDWHVAIAGAMWMLKNSSQPFEQYANQIDEKGGGLAGLEAVLGSKIDHALAEKVSRLARESYGGETACRQLFGFDPETLRGPGRWKSEVPLVSKEQLEPIYERAGIVTGRRQPAMDKGFEVLGWSLPQERVAVCDDESLNKPNPTKLMAILDRLKSKNTIYAGDARDDLELVRNAQKAGVDIEFCYIGEAPVPWEGVKFAYESVTEMLKSIEVKYE